MKISGAIFDMDGTLTDSMFVWETVGKRYLINSGITPRSDLWETIKSMSMQQIAEHFDIEYGIHKDADEIRDGVYALIEPMYRDEVLPKTGVVGFLQKLKDIGVKMCVATATDKHVVDMVLKKNGMLDFFSGIFTCSGVGADKESPLIYEKALEFMGTPKEETFVFEDALYAVNTAKNAGFPVVGVFDPAALNETDEIKSLSDYYIEDYRNSSIF